jgi:hypothetical protein
MLNNFFIVDDGRLEELVEFVQLARDHFAALLPDVCYPVEDGKNWDLPDDIIFIAEKIKESLLKFC